MSPQNPPSPKFGLMASGIVHWKTYCIWNTICAIRFYNVKYIHRPTNLWQEWNHAPSKNSNHIQKTDSVEKDSSTKPRRILTWLLFILSLRSSTEHLKLFFDIFGNTHLNLSDYLSVKPPQPQTPQTRAPPTIEDPARSMTFHDERLQSVPLRNESVNPLPARKNNWESVPTVTPKMVW